MHNSRTQHTSHKPKQPWGQIALIALISLITPLALNAASPQSSTADTQTSTATKNHPSPETLARMKRLGSIKRIESIDRSKNTLQKQQQADTIIDASQDLEALLDHYQTLNNSRFNIQHLNIWVEGLTATQHSRQPNQGFSTFTRTTTRGKTLTGTLNNFRDTVILNTEGRITHINLSPYHSGYYPENEAGIALLARFSQLKGLVIGRHATRRDTLDLSALKHLEEFDLLFDNKVDNILFANNNTLKVFSSTSVSLKQMDFSHLTQLEYIQMTGAEFEQLQGLANSQQLVILDIENNQFLTSLPSLTHFKHLEYLDFTAPRITSIKDLETAKNLKRLETSSHFDLENAKFPENLEYLRTAEINGQYFPKLDHLTKLKKLRLHMPQLKAITGLEHLTKLEKLSLSGNKVKKISGLETLINLKELTLSNNKIEAIENLENLENLEVLALKGNNITKVEGLETLKKLERLNLEKNNITTVEGLKNNTRLKLVNLNSNPISTLDFAEVEHLKFTQLFLGYSPYYKNRSKADKQKLHNLRHKGHF